MKETLGQLQALQDLALQVEQLTRDKETLNADVRDKERMVQEKQRRAEHAHQQRIEATKKGDAIQLKIDEAEQEVQKLNAQLNVTRHQDEYDAIKRFILSHQADIQKWEDEELAALEAVDELTEERERLQKQVAEAKDDLERVRQDVADQASALQRRIDELLAKHAGMRKEVRPTVLAAYDRLTAAHIPNALASVRNRVCQGCHTQITKQTELRLLRGTEMVYCQSCGRILALEQ